MPGPVTPVGRRETPLGADGRRRCFGNGANRAHCAEYHDREWGVPVRDDRTLFELLLLESAQAGLSWETILRKREGYRAVFEGFDPARVARMSDASLDAAAADARIVRHRGKVHAARANARAFLDLAEAHGGFAAWLWGHVDGVPTVNAWRSLDDVPVTTPLSDTISRALKRAGMSFVGSTTVQAYVQGVGLVDDHVADCWKRAG